MTSGPPQRPYAERDGEGLVGHGRRSGDVALLPFRTTTTSTVTTTKWLTVGKEKKIVWLICGEQTV